MKTWFITGASRGFGREVALEALRRGDRVVATARSLNALDDLVASDPERVAAAQLDVTKPDEIARSIEIARDRFGSINILFNNAGIGHFAAIEESDDAHVRRLMEINVFGLAAVTKAWLPHLREQRSGLIINTSSIGGIRSFPAVGWYNASKFAVEGLSEALAQETEPLGIKVVIVEPGPFATDWAGNSAAEVPDADAIADYDQTAGKQRRTFRENVGQEPGDPAKAARVIVDVAHDDHPPLRLPLGNFGYDGLLEKFDMVRKDVAPREAASRGADRDRRASDA
ncbi:oxidoreductase [Bradyrhizobium ottawaense]|uniref:oxidoreductase n=1 Tax=Bradyrhizobium ottawaense TaxID=931866 RepID=UPI0035152386